MIYRENGTTYWQYDISKEVSNVIIAFKILEDEEFLPPGYKKSSGHLILNMKMDFTRKAWWVKDGHKTTDPESSSYAGVVSIESVRILHIHSSIYGVPVTAEDVCNTHLQAPLSKKHYVICGTKFVLKNIWKKVLITRALYGGARLQVENSDITCKVA